MNICTIVGARPQLIKASVVCAALSRDPATRARLIHTGQHFDPNMSQVFFDELGMRAPDVQLNVHGGGHGEMTGRMMSELERELIADRPDAVIVYGDTNSTLAGALVAAKLNVPVAHVEAGLRSFNRRMPEEINRILTDHVSRWLFAPTAVAVEHLRREGIPAVTVHRVGDVMYDVALHFAERADARTDSALDRLHLRDRPYVLVTVHRAENTDDAARLAAILGGLARVARDTDVVWPLHPRTRLAMERVGTSEALAGRVRFIEPIGYLDMVQLERHAAVVATDSGGVQKEAYFHRVPCVTLRNETEWTELVELGWNRLAPPESADDVFSAIAGAMGCSGREAMPYGHGHAAVDIVDRLRTELA